MNDPSLTEFLNEFTLDISLNSIGRKFQRFAPLTVNEFSKYFFPEKGTRSWALSTDRNFLLCILKFFLNR